MLVRDGEVVHRFTDVTQPGGFASAGGRAAVIDVDKHTLSLYDPAELTRVGRVDAGDGPTHLVADQRGRLAVARGNLLLIFATQPELEQVDEVDLDGAPYGITHDSQRDQLWVTLTARNEVVGLDVTDLREVAGFPRSTSPTRWRATRTPAASSSPAGPAAPCR